MTTPSKPEPSFCQMEGRVAMLRVVGEGRAVLVEPAPFKDGGASQVSLIGATVGGHVDNPRLGHPAQLEPLGMNPRGKPFDVTYAAGKPFRIDVTAGGDGGGYQGPLPDGTDCPPEWCRVVWRGTAKHIELTRDGDGPFPIASRLPFGVDPGEGDRPASSLELVELYGFSGVLRCGEDAEHLEGAYRWVASETHTLRIRGLSSTAGDRIWATGSAIEVHAENDRRPEPMRPFPWGPVVAGVVLFIGVVLVVARAQFRRSRASFVSASDGERSGRQRGAAVSVFISAAPEDARYHGRLEKTLRPMVRAGRIEILGATDASGGSTTTTNEARLRTADLILLLVSGDFMASDQCHEVELKIALDRHARHDVRMVPILLRSVDLVGTALEGIQCLPRAQNPDTEKPEGISSYADEDLAYHEVAVEIRKIVEEMELLRAGAGAQSSSL